MLAIILARGLGTRMRRADPGVSIDAAQASAADGGLKAMMPVAGRPFLDYVLSGLADAGYERAVVVVAPDHAALREYYARQRPERIALAFAVQPEPRGTADAVLAADRHVGGDAFVVMNADNYYPVDVLATLREADEPSVVLFERDGLLALGNIPADRIASYAIVTIGDDGFLASVEEKPASVPPGNRPISMNLWRFDRAILEACRRVPPSSRGEVELPRAVDYGIRHLGLRLRARTVRRPVLDLSYRADIAVVAERLRAVHVRP